MRKTVYPIALQPGKSVFLVTIFSLSFIVISLFVFSGRALAQGEAAGAILAIEEKPMAGGGKMNPSTGEGHGKLSGSAVGSSSSAHKSGGKSAGKTTKSNPPRAQPVSVRPDTSSYDGMVIGDKYSFLNFEIASKVQPIYTLKAKNAGASGLVQVEVLIDQNGNVLNAHARTGNALLHPEAEKAALATKFNTPSVYGKPARALGFVVYRFGKAEDEDEDED